MSFNKFHSVKFHSLYQFQQSQVDKFCEEYEMIVKEYGNPKAEVFWDRQMLVSDKTQTAYCYVPKAGCTTQKVLLFLSLGNAV